MAHDDDVRDAEWIDECLKVLEAPGSADFDVARARGRLSARVASARHRRHVGIAVALAAVGLFVLPWPRAVAKELWHRLVLGRVAIIDVGEVALPETLTAVFTMETGPYEANSVGDLAEAAREAGFRPSLPPSEVLAGTPRLSVVKHVTLSTRPLRVAEIEQALAAAHVTDVAVPREWEGMTLVAEGGPAVVAEYDGVDVMQSAPFRMTMSSEFQFGRFMEVAFRVFGRSAAEAHALGLKFGANPALVMHFPERTPVREVPLRFGRTGLFIGDPDGTDICFFWNSDDRIFIVDAAAMTIERAAEIANSIP